jgi:hypothetical protein
VHIFSCITAMGVNPIAVKIIYIDIYYCIAIFGERPWCLLGGSIGERSMECCVWWRGAWRSQIATHYVAGRSTPIHSVLSTAPRLSISRGALGALSEDGNVMPKRAETTVHN